MEKAEKTSRVYNWQNAIVLVLLVGAAAIFAFHTYINNREVAELREKIKSLEERFGHVGIEEDHNNTLGNQVLNMERRMKRQINESNHLNIEHHGIGSHRIALIHADPDVLDANNATDWNHKFRKYTHKNRRNGCLLGLDLMHNNAGDVLCNRTHGRHISRMKFTQRSLDNGIYPFFSKAPWMYSPESKENFMLQESGMISVHTKGMYIISASIHFSINRPRTFPQFSIYREDGYNSNKRLITKCIVSVNSNDTVAKSDDIFPCQAWQLVALEARDQIYMNVATEVWFRIEKETFYLALIKLNDE